MAATDCPYSGARTRQALEIVQPFGAVALFQPAGQKIVQQVVPGVLSLPDHEGVGMDQRLVLHEKDVHAPQDDGDAPFTEIAGDFVSAQGGARHERDPDEIGLDGAEVDLLDVLVEDAYVEAVVGVGRQDGQVQLGHGGFRSPPRYEAVLVGCGVDQDQSWFTHAGSHPGDLGALRLQGSPGGINSASRPAARVPCRTLRPQGDPSGASPRSRR